MSTQDYIDVQLYDACEKKDLSKVATLLLIGADSCKVTNNKCEAAIHEAAVNSGDSTDILEEIFLFGNVKDINVKSSRYGEGTPLMFACRNGNVKCARLLVNNGADVSGTLSCSVESGSMEMFEECLKWKKWDVNDGAGDDVGGLLWSACYRGNVEGAKLLVKLGANTKAKTAKGHDLLYASVMSHSLEMVEVCLKWEGVDVRRHFDSRTNHRTPLLNAVDVGDVKIASLLVKSGADLSREGNNGNSIIKLLEALERTIL